MVAETEKMVRPDPKWTQAWGKSGAKTESDVKIDVAFHRKFDTRAMFPNLRILAAPKYGKLKKLVVSLREILPVKISQESKNKTPPTGAYCFPTAISVYLNPSFLK